MSAPRGCTEQCWTPTLCPDHGKQMNPWGRSIPLGMSECCDNSARSRINPRHLWDEHDSDRHYVDPAGWAEHERTCSRCGGDA